MTKADYLNAASDLRRIANWMARNQKEKIGLANRLWNDIKNKDEIFRIIRHFVGKRDPLSSMKNKKSRLFFAEQVLTSSLRLQSLESSPKGRMRWKETAP